MDGNTDNTVGLWLLTIFPDPTALAVSVKYGMTSKYKYASETL
jgi:hypothetical protein